MKHRALLNFALLPCLATSARAANESTPLQALLGQFTASDVPATGSAEIAVERNWPDPTTPPPTWPGNGLAQHPMLPARTEGAVRLARPTTVTANGVGRCCITRGRGREQLVAEDRDDPGDDDEHAGGADPANPYPTGCCSCSPAADHGAIQGAAVLPAGMCLSICRR